MLTYLGRLAALAAAAAAAIEEDDMDIVGVRADWVGVAVMVMVAEAGSEGRGVTTYRGVMRRKRGDDDDEDSDDDRHHSNSNVEKE